ncbi:736_t:CDS:2 [Scutellospora calospora]|uniref:736_t:CDS:1 n=1 Tax=Scutellospora calospora TaxID=85575 RepID=A0ACA9KSZ1_9GLOM|nr:736_t:CDS:2 [Scutellospora calospora]
MTASQKTFYLWFEENYKNIPYYIYVLFTFKILLKIENIGYEHLSLNDLENSLYKIGKLRHKLLESNRHPDLSKYYKHRELITSKKNCFKNLQANSLLSFTLAQLVDEVDRAAKYRAYKKKENDSDSDGGYYHLFEVENFSFSPENLFRWLKRFKTSRKSPFRAIIEEQISILYGVGDTIEHIVMLQTLLRNGVDPFLEFENGKNKPTQDDADIWLIMVYTTSKLLEKLEKDMVEIEEPQIDFIYTQLINDLEPFLKTIQDITIDIRWKESELIEDYPQYTNNKLNII